MKRYLYFVLVVLLAACQQVKVPTDFTRSDQLPTIYPDYTDVTIPVNIAPLSFELQQPATQMVARYSFGDEEIVCGGEDLKACPDIDEWHQLPMSRTRSSLSISVVWRITTRTSFTTICCVETK